VNVFLSTSKINTTDLNLKKKLLLQQIDNCVETGFYTFHTVTKLSV